jgi:hypothetical protein
MGAAVRPPPPDYSRTHFHWVRTGAFTWQVREASVREDKTAYNGATRLSAYAVNVRVHVVGKITIDPGKGKKSHVVLLTGHTKADWLESAEEDRQDKIWKLAKPAFPIAEEHLSVGLTTMRLTGQRFVTEFLATTLTRPCPLCPACAVQRAERAKRRLGNEQLRYEWSKTLNALSWRDTGLNLTTPRRRA